MKDKNQELKQDSNVRKLNVPIKKMDNLDPLLEKSIHNMEVVKSVKTENDAVAKFITPIEIPTFLKMRLLENKMSNEKSRETLEQTFKTQMTALSVSEQVRQDEMLKNFSESQGFKYGTKYSIEEDFSFIHVFDKLDKSEEKES
jgi:hypothetical protein